MVVKAILILVALLVAGTVLMCSGYVVGNLLDSHEEAERRRKR